MSHRVLFVSIVAALALAGCATVPKPIAGTYAPVSLESARTETAATPIRWGGQIIQTEPQQQETCFFVLAQALDSQARPKAGGESLGRFVACKQGFYDPEVFSKGRQITVTGTLAGTVQHKIGEFEYTYPKVAASTVYLWKPEAQYTPAYYNSWGPWGPWGDPFWGGGFGPWGYGPWYYPPRVIVVPRPAPPSPPPTKG